MDEQKKKGKPAVGLRYSEGTSWGAGGGRPAGSPKPRYAEGSPWNRAHVLLLLRTQQTGTILPNNNSATVLPQNKITDHKSMVKVFFYGPCPKIRRNDLRVSEEGIADRMILEIHLQIK
jgi:hypothetical protein